MNCGKTVGTYLSFGGWGTCCLDDDVSEGVSRGLPSTKTRLCTLFYILPFKWSKNVADRD